MWMYIKLSHEINKERSHVSHKNRCFKIFSLAQFHYCTLSVHPLSFPSLQNEQNFKCFNSNENTVRALLFAIIDSFVAVCVRAYKCSVSTDRTRDKENHPLTTIYSPFEFYFPSAAIAASFRSSSPFLFYFISFYFSSTLLD